MHIVNVGQFRGFDELSSGSEDCFWNICSGRSTLHPFGGRAIVIFRQELICSIEESTSLPHSECTFDLRGG